MTQDDRDALRPLVERLPRSIEPPHDLWPGVRARLARDARRPTRRFLALAIAAGIAVAVASSAVTAWVLRHDPQTAPLATAPADPALPATPVTGREAAYVRATSTLVQELAARRDELAPETIAVLERNLAIIDRAIAESRAALARDPSNGELEQLLWTSYERKVSLLEQAARIAAPS